MISDNNTLTSQDQYQSIFTQDLVGVAFVNLNGQFTNCNERFASFYKETPQSLNGKSVTELSKAEDSGCYLDGLKKLLSLDNHRLTCEQRVHQVDGSILWCLFNWTLVKDKNGVPLYFVMICQDIGESKQSQVTTTNSAMMGALGKMAGGIAHEINNPLAIIQGKAMQLYKHIPNGKLTMDYIVKELAKIVETTERMSKIVNGLSSFSRNANKDPFIKNNLKIIMSNVLRLCMQKFKADGIKLDVLETPDLSFDCRGVQLEQVLLNLLNNAHDAVFSLPEKWVQIEFKTTGDRLEILIKDSGKGIKPEVASQMMQPFFTTKEVGKGTGLGLSISKGIIEDHKGYLRFDSSAENTCFIIELPLALDSKKQFGI